MTDHVCIRHQEYVAGTRERPEVGIFTQTHMNRPPVPWDRLAAGDTVWMKWSRDLVVAIARVRDFRQQSHCTPNELRAATVGYKLHDLEAYWASLPPFFFAVVVYLDDERWLSPAFLPAARSRGESWIVLDRPELRDAWLSAAPEPPPEFARSPSIDSPRARPRSTRAISPAMRFEVLRRDNFTCRYCGRRPPVVALHAEHVVPSSQGGANSLDNLVAACSDCNFGKGARRLDSMRPDERSSALQPPTIVVPETWTAGYVKLGR